jgi:small subunit ribosomal protein S8
MYSALRNGSVANRRSIIYPKNSLCLQVLKVLYNEGYINGFRSNPKNTNTLEIFLKYNNGKAVVKKINSMSKPGRRLYVSINALWKLKTSLSTLIVSTPKGILSDKQCRKLHQGGEVLCIIS